MEEVLRAGRHDRRRRTIAGGALCRARTRQTGQPCRRPAGWGTNHVGYGQCKLHGGSTRNGWKHAAKLEMFQVVALAMLLHRPRDPATQFEVRRSWAQVKRRARAQEEES